VDLSNWEPETLGSLAFKVMAQIEQERQDSLRSMVESIDGYYLGNLRAAEVGSSEKRDYERD